MNKVVIGTLVASTAVVALGATSILVADKQVDNAVMQMTDAASSMLAVEVLEDDNRFLSRQLNVSLSINDLDNPFTLIIENSLSKKPWGTVVSHAVSFDKSFLDSVNEENAMAIMQKNFVDQPFLVGETSISMTGNYQSKFDTVEMNETVDDVEVMIGSLAIQAMGDINGALKLDGQWPGLNVSVDDLESVSFVVKPIEFHADGSYVNSSLFEGTQDFVSEGLEFVMSSEWDKQSLTTSGLTSSSVTEITNDRLSTNVTLASPGFVFVNNEEALTVNDINLALGISGINADNYMKIMDGLNQMQVTGVPGADLMESGNQLLQDGFSIDLTDWRAEIKDQSFAMDASFTLPENDIADVNNPFSLMGLVGEIKANAEMAMDIGLADVPEVAGAMMGLLMTGALVEDGEEYTLDFTMEDGAAELNGEALPLPF
jgi:hypothetical protein